MTRARAAARARLPGATRARRRPAAVAVRRGGARARSAASGRSARRSCSAPPRRCTSTFRLLRDELLDDRRAGRRRGSASCASTPTSTSRTPSCATSSCSSSPRCWSAAPAGQAVADALPEVNARLLQAATAEQREIFETSRARRATCWTPSATSGCARAAVAARDGAVARAVPAPARRRAGALRLRHRDLPDVPAEVQVRARVPDPAGADAQPALRDPRPPGARALPRRRRRRARCAELLGLLDAGWRRGGFGDSDEERQLREQGRRTR